jgi:hypothetical protein
MPACNSRSANPPANPAAEKPSLRTVECSSCGATHHFMTGTIPVGWCRYGAIGSVWCSECTVLGIPEREIDASKKALAA